MKKIYWIILFIFLYARGFPQNNLIGYEYWFNGDFAGRQEITIPTAGNHSISDDVDVSHLPEGLNRFMIRYKDENGFYSSTSTKTFIKHTLSELTICEYWFDNDYAGRQEIAFAPSGQHQYADEINVSNLSAGIHVFHIRYKGNNGIYSNTQSKTFLHIPGNKQLTHFEYWFNNDFENRTGLALTPATEHQIIDNIDASGVDDGLNTISFRVKDNSGYYSSPTTMYFYRDEDLMSEAPDLTAFEYWFNNDYENRKVNMFNPASGQQLTTLIDAATLPEGVNVFNIRFKDETGKYSVTQSEVFYRKSYTTVTSNNMLAYEYWFNNDYENRVENAFSPAASQNLTSLINAAALSEGVNVFNIRFKDETGRYSVTQSEIFYRKSYTTVTSNNMLAYEYWFNNDYENRVVNAFSPAAGQNLTSLINAAALPEGVNVFNIRVKDETGKYSATLSEVIYKSTQTVFSSNKMYAYRYRIEDENGIAQGGDPQTDYTEVNLTQPVNPAIIDLDIDMAQIPKGTYYFLFSSLDSLGLWSVTTTDTIVKTAFPISRFEVKNEQICSNTIIRFQNESIDADTWHWDFGDGNISFEFEPEHIYTEAGEYEVQLLVTDTTSGLDSLISHIVFVENCAIYTNLHFNPGWNLFSVPAEPEAANLKELFQPLIDNGSLLKIQDEAGNALEDWGMIGGWKDFIGDISPTEGYKIRVAFEDELEVCGLPPNYPFAIPLSSGWNIMGFPHTSSFNALKVLQPLIDNGTLQKVQDEAGNAIEDWGMIGGWKNFIGEFSPGKGFKIKLASDDILWIEEAYPKSTAILTETVPASYFKPGFPGNGVDHMNINVTGLPENILHPGDELAVFDGEICVGAISLLPHHFTSQAVSIPVSANDNFGMPGFSEGNTIILKLWSSLNNREYLLKPDILNGTSTFVKHESALVSLGKYAATGLEAELQANKTEINCYPNPFNDKITIEINLAEDAEVQVDVFNKLGQLVKILASKRLLTAGRHNIVWDGKNTGNQNVSPGIYHVRFLSEEVQMIRKIILSGK